MPEKHPPRAGVVDETARGNHHHEPADGKKDIDPRSAVGPFHSGSRGIDPQTPQFERVIEHDEQGSDGARR